MWYHFNQHRNTTKNRHFAAKSVHGFKFYQPKTYALSTAIWRRMIKKKLYCGNFYLTRCSIICGTILISIETPLKIDISQQNRCTGSNFVKRKFQPNRFLWWLVWNFWPFFPFYQNLIKWAETFPETLHFGSCCAFGLSFYQKQL